MFNSARRKAVPAAIKRGLLHHAVETLEDRRLLSAGSGLTGFYYANTALTNYQFNRLDPQINLSGSAFPGNGLAANNFSVHWDGLLTPAVTSDTYTFYANVTGGERLWINGTQIINSWTQHAGEDASTTVTLNGPVNVRLEYFSTSATPAISLSWSSANVTKAIVPTANEFPLTTGLGSYTQQTISTIGPQVTGSLPAPWTANAVGGLVSIGGVSETSSYTGPVDTTQGSFKITGGGSFASGTANDQLEFASQKITGDFTLTAQLNSMLTPAGGVPNNGALAGLMVRTDLTPTSPYVFLGFQPSGYVWQSHRQWAAGTPQAGSEASGSAGVYGYIRLIRQGSGVSIYYSRDGVSWVFAFTQEIFVKSDSVYIGMAADARSSTLLCNAIFSNVALTSPPSSNATSAIGNSFTGANEHVIAGAYAAYVDPQGYLYIAGRDEAKGVGVFNPDGSLNSYAIKSHFNAGLAITADSNFIFSAQNKQGDGVAGIQRYDHLGNSATGTQNLGAEILGGDTITGLVESPVTGLLYVAGNNMVYEFQPSTMSFTGRAFEADNSADMAVDSSGNLWIIQNANGTTAAQVEHVVIPNSGTITGLPNSTITFTTGYSGLTVIPVGIAINAAGSVYVTDTGQLQQIHIFNSSGIHTGDFGTAYGVYGGATPGVNQPLSFDYPIGVGFDSSGDIYVVNGGITQTLTTGVQQQNSDIIRKFTSAGLLIWERQSAVYQDVAGADPTDPTCVVLGQYAYSVNYSNTDPGTEQTLLGPTVEPFKHLDDPRITPVGGTGGVNSETGRIAAGVGNIIRYITIGGVTHKYLFEVNGSQSGPIMIYRFDPANGPYATVFCGQIWPNLDNGYKKTYAWMDLNGDGTKQANEESTTTNWLSYSFGASVDANGNIWLTDSDQNVVYEYKPVSFSNGAVVYNLSLGKHWSVAGIFTRACRVIYNVPTQTLFLTGYTTANDKNLDGFGLAGSTLFVYRGFVDTMSTLPASPTWAPTVFRTTDTDATRIKAIDVDPSGNFVFAALVVPGAGINIIRFQTQNITTIFPTPEGGAWDNLVDLPNAINATQLVSGPYKGQYIINVEDVEDARSTMYRWNSAWTVPRQGWVDGDIGSPAIAGTASYDINSATWTLQGAGSQVGTTSDQFNLASQLFTGDGSVVANVKSLTGGNASAGSGVVFRDSLATNSMYVAALFEPNNGNGAISFSWRSATGANANSTLYTFPTATTSQWLKVTRQGNDFSGYFSSDGITWTVAGAVQNIGIAATATVGLAINSGQNSTLATVTLGNVSVNTAIIDSDLGSPGKSGSATFSDYHNVWTVAGGGSDIAGASDQFNFASKMRSGDGTIIAQISSLTNPTAVLNGGAKAGVMFRAGNGATDFYAGVFATPGNGVSFQWRNNAGITATSTLVGLTLPLWVKLVRTDNAFSGFYSVDGVTWSQIGSAVSVIMGLNAQVGLAVTSHDNSSLAVARFMNVSITGSVVAPTTTLLSDSADSLTITSGSKFVVNAPNNHADRTVLILNSLSLTGGQLDLSANDLILHNGNLGTVISQIQSGAQFGSELWNGLGITSSAAGGDSKFLTALGVIQNSGPGVATYYTSFDGQSVIGSDLLIKYTYFGDANLDGKVDSSDYSRIDSGFVTHASGWANGDFNYDGVVNGSDYTLIDNAFNTQGVSLATEQTGQSSAIEHFVSPYYASPNGATNDSWHKHVRSNALVSSLLV